MFKVENGDPVLDIKCIFGTEMILHAPSIKLRLSNECFLDVTIFRLVVRNVILQGLK